jgi:hypothetical protein
VRRPHRRLCALPRTAPRNARARPDGRGMSIPRRLQCAVHVVVSCECAPLCSRSPELVRISCVCPMFASLSVRHLRDARPCFAVLCACERASPPRSPLFGYHAHPDILPPFLAQLTCSRVLGFCRLSRFALSPSRAGRAHESAAHFQESLGRAPGGLARVPRPQRPRPLRPFPVRGLPSPPFQNRGHLPEADVPGALVRRVMRGWCRRERGSIPDGGVCRGVPSLLLPDCGGRALIFVSPPPSLPTHNTLVAHSPRLSPRRGLRGLPAVEGS